MPGIIMNNFKVYVYNNPNFFFVICYNISCDGLKKAIQILRIECKWKWNMRMGLVRVVVYESGAINILCHVNFLDNYLLSN